MRFELTLPKGTSLAGWRVNHSTTVSYWIMKTLIIWISLLSTISSVKRKSEKHEFGSDVIHGGCAPLGPLSNHYIAKLRLPGFPFEFPPILPDTTDRYLIFPAPDSLADYDASQRRCSLYKGKLVEIESPVEMEILACAIGTPSFVGGWMESAKDGNCIALHPGGIVSISQDNCKKNYGSICKIPKSTLLEGFQI